MASEKDKKSIYEIVNAVEKEIIESRKDNYRCHEMARLNCSRLNYEGIKSEVKDGLVIYSPEFINEFWFKGKKPEDFDEIDEILYGKPVKKPKIYMHSWCESGDLIIDTHRVFIIDRGLRGMRYREGLVIIEDKKDLDGKIEYNNNGKEVELFGKNFVYIPYFLNPLLNLQKLRI